MSTRQSYTPVQVHSVHSPAFDQVNPDEGYRRSLIGPPQPDNLAASMGDYCAAVLIWPEIKARVTASYQAPSRAIARDLAAGVVADFEAELPTAVACFMDDFEACIAHLRMPIPHRRAIRTTNLLERLFVEERRRLKIIPNAFGEKPVLKLMFGAMIRAAERWRAIRITDFERRQMKAVRQELDHEYEARNDLTSKPSADANQTKFSSTSRT